MIVVCKCGKRRTAQPYKDARTIDVNECYHCKPGKLNRPLVKLSTADQMRRAYKRILER